LQAPGACGPIRLDRFSPYFEDAASFGLCNVRALPVYRCLYPEDVLDVEQVAYYFDFDYAPGREPARLAGEAVALAEAQRDAPDNGQLTAMAHIDGGLVLRDTRACARQAIHRFDARERCILERIDELAAVPQVRRALETRFPGERFEDAAVAALLDFLVDAGVALKEEGGAVAHYLGLAVMTGPLRPALEAASRRQAGGVIPIASQRVALPGA
jgi:hypothetical protein